MRFGSYVKRSTQMRRYVEEMALIVGIEENCLAQKVGIKGGGGGIYVTM